MDMSKAIREGRDRLGMSQEALAERLGVSRQAVSKWEMGTSVPSPENRRALSEILGTDLQVERETAPPVPLRSSTHTARSPDRITSFQRKVSSPPSRRSCSLRRVRKLFAK